MIVSFFSYFVNKYFVFWVFLSFPPFLSTTTLFSMCCCEQVSKISKNIRNLLSFWCKIKLPNKNLTKQKERGFLMTYFTSNTYQIKWKILTFSNKISKCLSKPEKKFTADITYGMLASGSCLLTDVVDKLRLLLTFSGCEIGYLPPPWFISMTAMW